jgi:3-oxocholest-4-en-26-oyl-CoA dehydrogenase alpha subunit
MRIEFTPEQKALRAEFRAYLAGLMTPEVRAATRERESGPGFRAAIRRMGQDGWIAPGWPVEYGGRGLDAIAQKIVLEELWLAGAPFPFVTVNTVGPTLIRLGTDQQKREILPRIARGELIFAIGYTEPNAGTDLANLATRAARDGDEFVVNGQKIYTSGAEGADYVWLAVRTNPDVPRHKGITIMMVDTRSPGFSVTPLHTVGGVRTNVTYYADVRVPASMVVGEVDRGWSLITEQLNHERLGLAALGYGGSGSFDALLQWAQVMRTPVGTRVIDEPRVRLALAEAYALLQANDTMTNRMAWEFANGQVRADFASACKVFGTECLIDVYRLLHEVAGPAALLRAGEPGAVLDGQLEEEYRRCQINTFGGGVNEVMRDIVAQVGLGLPRVARAAGKE